MQTPPGIELARLGTLGLWRIGLLFSESGTIGVERQVARRVCWAVRGEVWAGMVVSLCPL